MIFIQMQPSTVEKILRRVSKAKKSEYNKQENYNNNNNNNNNSNSNINQLMNQNIYVAP